MALGSKVKREERQRLKKGQCCTALNISVLTHLTGITANILNPGFCVDALR